MENRLIQSTAQPDERLSFNEQHAYISKLLKENFKKEFGLKKQSKWHLNKLKTQ